MTSMKRRLISALLVIVLLTTSCPNTLAAVLQVPSGLKTIEEAAFEGDWSLDGVVLPEGLESIESRAFEASSVHSVNLPASLRSIADDAFPGPDQVEVQAEAGTYAYGWAVSHGYLTGFTFTDPEVYQYETDRAAFADDPDRGISHEPWIRNYDIANYDELRQEKQGLPEWNVEIVGDAHGASLEYEEFTGDGDGNRSLSVGIQNEPVGECTIQYRVSCTWDGETIYSVTTLHYLAVELPTGLDGPDEIHGLRVNQTYGFDVRMLPDGYSFGNFAYPEFWTEMDCDNWAEWHEEGIVRYIRPHEAGVFSGWLVKRNNNIRVQRRVTIYVEDENGSIPTPVPLFYDNSDLYLNIAIVPESLREQGIYGDSWITDFWLSNAEVLQKEYGDDHSWDVAYISGPDLQAHMEDMWDHASFCIDELPRTEEPSVYEVSCTWGGRSVSGRITLNAIQPDSLPTGVILRDETGRAIQDVSMMAGEWLYLTGEFDPDGWRMEGREDREGIDMWLDEGKSGLELSFNGFSGAIHALTPGDYIVYSHTKSGNVLGYSELSVHVYDYLGHDECIDLLFDMIEQNTEDTTGPYTPLETISTTDITDPLELEQIAEYNQAVEQINADLALLYQQEMDISNAFSGSLGQLPDSSVSETDSQMTFLIGGMSVVLDKSFISAADQNIEITDFVTDENGRTRLITSDEREFYLYQSGNTWYCTDSAPGSGTPRSSRGASESKLNQLSGLVENIQDIFSQIEELFAVGLSGLDSKISDIENAFDSLEELRSRHTGNVSQLEELRQYTRLKELNRLKARRTGWVALRRVWSGLNIISNIVFLHQIISNWAELIAIEGHGHPTENDRSARAGEVSISMNRNIRMLEGLYLVDGLLNAVQIVGCLTTLASAIPTGGTSAAVGLALNALQMVVGIALNAGEEKLYRDIGTAHNKLHTRVYGRVLDKDTGNGLEGVKVTDGDAEVYTDNLGQYELYLMPGTVKLTLTLENYIDKTTTATPAAGFSTQIPDIKMERMAGVLWGHVYDEATRERLSGVTVSDGTTILLTNDEGYYEISVIPGDVSVSFSKKGYEEETPTVQIAQDQRFQRDILLKKRQGPSVMSGYVYDKITGQRLSGVTVSSGDVYTVSNANGAYAITLNNEPCDVTFSRENYTPYTYSITDDPWENFTKDIYLITDTHFVLYGIIKNGRSPYDVLPGVEIYTSVTGDDPAATCDGGGHYEIVLPRGEAINVEYRLDDFQSANDSFSGDEIGYYEENIYLWQWRHAHGKVVTTSGAPLAGVKVTSEQGWTTYTQGDGTYDLIHMEYYGPGFPLRLRFTKEGYDFANGYVIMFGEMHVYLDDVRMYPE